MLLRHSILQPCKTSWQERAVKMYVSLLLDGMKTVLVTFVTALTKYLIRSNLDKKIYFGLQFEGYSPSLPGKHGCRSDRLLVILHKQVGSGYKPPVSPLRYPLLPARIHFPKVPHPSQSFSRGPTFQMP